MFKKGNKVKIYRAENREGWGRNPNEGYCSGYYVGEIATIIDGIAYGDIIKVDFGDNRRDYNVHIDEIRKHGKRSKRKTFKQWCRGVE